MVRIKKWTKINLLLFGLIGIFTIISNASFNYNLGSFWRIRSSDLTITPTTNTMKPGRLWKVSGSNGIPPYTYSVQSGGGSINASTGVFTAPATSSTVTIRVTDAALSVAEATFTISAPGTINCANQTVYEAVGTFYDPQGTSNYIVDQICSIIFQNPAGVNVSANFSVFNTEQDYDFVKFYNSVSTLLASYSGTSIPAAQNQANGYLRLEFNSDPAIVGPGFVGAWVNTQSGTPFIVADKVNLNANEAVMVSVYDGVAPYSMAIQSGPGSIAVVDGDTINFQSPFSDGSTVIRVTDSLGQIDDVTINFSIGTTAVTSVSPLTGPKTGGTSVTVYGSGFKPGATVNIDGNSCTGVTVIHAGELTCTTPAGMGLVDVTVNNLDLTSGSGNNIFAYEWGSWIAMSNPGAGMGRVGNARVWTGNKFLVWGGQSQSCNYSVCLKSDGYIYDPVTDSWSAMSASPLAARVHMAYAWIGDSMLIFSGRNNVNGASMDCVSSDGAKYNPYTDTWTSIAVPAWTRRQNFSFVWSGKELLVWGGQGDYTIYDHGNAYNPSSNTWRAIAGSGKARWFHAAHWTGQKMMIWGGINYAGSAFYNDGRLYDPDTNTWSAMTSSPSYGIYSFENFFGAMGEKAYINSGYQSTPGSSPGAYYNSETDSWVADNKAIAPGAAFIWTGKHLLSYVGTSIDAFDPENNNWYPSGVTSSRSNHWGSHAWTGKYLLSCFGANQTGFSGGGTGYDTCEKFDFADLHNRLSGMNYDVWQANTNTNAPPARSGHSTIWTGKNQIVWGGYDGGSYLNSGAKYDPVSDSWSSVTTTNAPTARINHSALWTGNRMIVWGGTTGPAAVTNTGAIYNPYTDSWITTNTGANVPSARQLHSSIWTGSKMIVWGGSDGSGVTASNGAIFNFATNTWSTMSSASAPTARQDHRAIWTGSKMIVWGGYSSGAYYNDGGIYDFGLNSWSATSVGANLPSGRRYFNIANTGSTMIIWGGETAAATYTNTGAVYNIGANTWTSTAITASTPDVRARATGVWTGLYLVIFGGMNSDGSLGDGAIYNYRTDNWTSLSTTSDPPARHDHSAAWTGLVGDGQSTGNNPYTLERYGDTGRMLIWGGYDGTSYLSDGFTYNLPNM